MIVYLFVLIFLKIISFWRVRQTAYYKKDTFALFIYFMIFLTWIINDYNLIQYASERYKQLKNNKPGPFVHFIDTYLKRNKNDFKTRH